MFVLLFISSQQDKCKDRAKLVGIVNIVLPCHYMIREPSSLQYPSKKQHADGFLQKEMLTACYCDNFYQGKKVKAESTHVQKQMYLWEFPCFHLCSLQETLKVLWSGIKSAKTRLLWLEGENNNGVNIALDEVFLFTKTVEQTGFPSASDAGR